MRKILTGLIFSLLLFGCNGEKSITTAVDEISLELIQDRNFNTGISLKGSNTSFPEPITTIYPFNKEDNKPLWEIAQWGSKNIITENNPIVVDDTVMYINDAKRIFFYPKDNDVFIGLETFTSNEYERARKENEDWVHLLLEQNFSNFTLLNTVDKINYKISSKLLFCENLTGSDYNPHIHTAQITLYLTIQNRVKDSGSYGDFFWFGLPLYDYRYNHLDEYGAQDLGKDDASKKFISTVSSKSLFQTSMHNMNWITIEKDIYPLIRNSFETAQSRGYMKGSKWDDLCISSMNIGWEVPGTFDCGIVFSSPSFEIIKAE